MITKAQEGLNKISIMCRTYGTVLIFLPGKWCCDILAAFQSSENKMCFKSKIMQL